MGRAAFGGRLGRLRANLDGVLAGPVVPAVAAVLFVLVFAVRAAFNAPESGTSYLYAVPVTLLAIRGGVRGGLVGAAIAAALIVAPAFVTDTGVPLGGYLPRIGTPLGVGLVVGWYAQTLREAQHERRRAVGELLRLGEVERARVATELHDDLVQALAAALVSLERIGRAAAAGEDARAEALAAETRAVLVDVLERARRLTFELRPQLLEARGLAGALPELAAEELRDTDVDVTLDVAGARHPAEVETLVYRVVQEALANVRRHAHARSVAVRIAVADGVLVGEVADDGVGFDVEATFDPRAGRAEIGLGTLVQRVELAGGTVDVASSPAGTSIRFRLPVARPAAVAG